MEIKVEQKSDNPLNDILDAILNLDEESFENVKATCDGWNYEELRFQYGDRQIDIPLSEILAYLNKSVSDKSDKKYDRIKQLLDTRDEDMFCSLATVACAGINSTEYPLVKKVFEILKDDNLFEKFKNFDENKNNFGFPQAIQKKYQNICAYLRVMISIFGSTDKEGKLSNLSPLLDEFYIPGINKCKDRCIEIYLMYEQLVREEEKKLKYRFEPRKTGDNVSIIEGEPDWKLNDEIKQKILEEMPKELSAEESAIYVYSQMCKVFTYDEGYLYRKHEQGEKINYTPNFSKEHLEALTTGSRITCFDFSRIYKKLVDSLDLPITVAVLAQGANNGHFYIGIASEKCQATLEAINVTERDGLRANDLARAKNNMDLCGIKCIDGDEKFLDNAIRKVSTTSHKNIQYTTSHYINELMMNDSLEDYDEQKIVGINILTGLIKKMQRLNISGNEFVIFFNDIFRRFGVINENLDRAFVGEVIREDNERKYRRKIWLRERQKDEFGNSKMYLIDAESLAISSPSGLQMFEKLKNGELVYENAAHRMSGFELEEK